MHRAQPEDSAKHRVLFVSRDPIIHQAGGSATAVANLLDLLVSSGSSVTLLSTMAYGRSPRVGFSRKVALPADVTLLTPGYLRVGRFFIRPYALKPWARGVSRAALRRAWLMPFSRLAQRLWGDKLYQDTWDLTPATDREMDLAIRQIEASSVNTVITNYLIWAPLFERMGADAKTVGIKRILMMHDLLSARTRRMQLAGQTLDTTPLDEATELKLLSTADVIIAAQDREAEFVRSHLSATVLTQPLVLKNRTSSQEVDANRCLFVGTRILPNVEGFKFFLHEVWPKILEQNPAATLAVVGSICSVEIEGFDAPGVEKLGFVPSIDSEYERAAVCVVPLLFGSGIKIKLLEALSFGKAIVSTNIGVQGLEDWTEGAIAVADDPAPFAEAVLGLLGSEEKRRDLEQGAVRLVRDHFTVESDGPQAFLRVLNHAGTGKLEA